ncbi:MAG: hypothetical protein LBK60_12710 [Verrucomicrobiales bacterium]|jgi:hypothetical protein|nr:hypothetical protein [Verrucomicrobiales bacterium]
MNTTIINKLNSLGKTGRTVLRVVCLGIVGVLAVITVAGCASTGNNFNMERTEKIQVGKTTKAQLVQWFGKPNRTSRSADGTQVLQWIYRQSSTKAAGFIPYAGAFMGGSDSSGKELTVHLRHGVVTDYSVSGDEMETRMNRTGAEGGSN